MKKQGKRIQNASCIRNGCGKQFDKSIPETRDSRTLRPFWQRYCPEHRVTGKTYEPIVEIPVKPARKRILSVTVKRMLDDSPDTSWLGEYSNQPTSEFSIDRAHSEDCIENDTPQKEELERIVSRMEDVQPSQDCTNLDAQEMDCLQRNLDHLCDSCREYAAHETAIEAVRELTECDCGERGDMSRGEYRYFNPSFNYVDKHGHALPENTPEEVRKYVRQDYERMESLNRGDWCFIGIGAEAEVWNAATQVTQKIRSGGLWGIESDSDDGFIEEEERNQLADLRTELLAYGFSSRAISKAFQNVQRKDA